jgi:hypothetical protein
LFSGKINARAAGSSCPAILARSRNNYVCVVTRPDSVSRSLHVAIRSFLRPVFFVASGSARYMHVYRVTLQVRLRLLSPLPFLCFSSDTLQTAGLNCSFGCGAGRERARLSLVGINARKRKFLAFRQVQVQRSPRVINNTRVFL